MLQLQLDSISEEKARGPFGRTLRKWLEEGIRTQNTSSVWKKRNVEISALYKIFASVYIDIRVDNTAFFLSIKSNAKVNIKLREIILGICVVEKKNLENLEASSYACGSNVTRVILIVRTSYFNISVW